VKGRPVYRFRLFIADGTDNSHQALANLTALCQARLPKQHEIEVVDVLREPMRALEDNVLMTPTLMVLSPPPVRRIVGTLSQTNTVLQVLGLKAAAA
jgi:circadian clock protein KaiB